MYVIACIGIECIICSSLFNLFKLNMYIDIVNHTTSTALEYRRTDMDETTFNMTLNRRRLGDFGTLSQSE